MNEEEDKMGSFRTRITNWTRRFLIEIIFVLVLVGVVIIIMQFMTPTIGNVFVEIDPCGPCLCAPDGGCDDRSYPVENTCNRDICTAWRHGLPEGKLVVIIPKTITVGYDTYGIGFSYPPANYSKNEISQITQQYLQELSLREDEVHIVEFDVLMGTQAYLRIYVPNILELNFYSNGRIIVATDKLTEWKIRFDAHRTFVEGMHDFRVVFHYSEQDSRCIEYCEELGEWLEPSENVDVIIKYPLSGR